ILCYGVHTMNTLNVWLPSWVILDGNYRNFRAGQEADFALLFDSLSGTKTSEGRPSLWPVKANQYRFCGQTIFWGQECWVLDAGVHGYCDYPIPPKAVEGTWWAGVLATRIDPFFYFEELSKHPAVPPLIYSWRIDRIRIDRTPRISERDEKGRLTLWRDEEREMFEELPATDAWAPAYRDLDYLLTCTRIGGPSRARRADYPAYDRADSRDHA